MSKAVEELIQKHKNLIGFVIKKWFPTLAEDDDIRQIGLIALWEAIKKYDETKGASLETFATRCIHNSIINELRKRNTSTRVANGTTVSLDDSDNWLSDITPDNAAKMENVVMLKDYIERQSESDRQMIYLKARGRTAKQIALQMDLAKRTVERRWAALRDEMMELKDVL